MEEGNKKQSTNDEKGDNAIPESTFYGMTRYQMLKEDKIEELDLYDMIRRPRMAPTESERPITPDTLEKLKGIFECPICRCLMQSPVYIKPCMHKFCHGCITKYFSKIKSQCPSCRAPIGSHRYLIPDKETKTLIEKLFPDIEAVEKRENEEVKLILQNLRSPLKLPEEEKSLVKSSKRSHPDSQEDFSDNPLIPSENNSIEFRLLPNPTLSTQGFPKYKLRTVRQIGLTQLAKFLGYKVKLSKKQVTDIKFVVHSAARMTEKLEGEETLEAIRKRYWTKNTSKIIYYNI